MNHKRRLVGYRRTNRANEVEDWTPAQRRRCIKKVRRDALRAALGAGSWS